MNENQHIKKVIINQKILNDFAEELRNGKFSSQQSFEIFLDYAGSLILSKSLIFNHQDVVIHGRGKDVTKIVVNNDFTFNDDCFIGVKGQVNWPGDIERPVSVVISDLSIESQVDRSIYTSVERKAFVLGCYAIKIYDALKVDIHYVRIYLEDIAGTNIDIRKGQNIKVTNCELINNNRQKTGGVLWLRGDIRNARIYGNVIRKYGNDEAFGLWSVNNYVGVTDGATEIRKEHIFVTGNEFYNEIVTYIPSVDVNHTGKGALDGGLSEIEIPTPVTTGIIGDWDGAIDRYLVIFTNQDDNLIMTDGGAKVLNCRPVRHIVRDVHIDGNDFYMNAPVKITTTFVFDMYTEYDNISFNDNKMIYSDWQDGTFDQSTYYGPMDVSVLYDVCYGDGNELDAANSYSGSCDSPIEVCRNLFKSSSHVIASYDNSEHHSCLNMEGTRVIFNDNTIEYLYQNGYTPAMDFAKAGYNLIYGSTKDFKVVANRNWATGLQTLMTVSKANSHEPINHVALEAYKNHFEGDTRIFTKNVQYATYCFCENYFKSDYELSFLVEQAQYQSATFNNNTLERNVINPLREKAFVYDAGYEGVGYQRCLFMAKGNVFRVANPADVSAENSVFSRFPQSQNAFCLFAEGNVDEANGSGSQQ